MRAFCFLLVVALACADKFNVGDDALVVKMGTPLLLRNVPMFAPEDAPSKGSPGNGESYVKIKLVFESAVEMTGTLQVSLIHSDSYSKIGVHEEGIRYCCSQADQQNGLCKQVRTLITGNPPETDQQDLFGTFEVSKTLTVSGTYNIKRSGQHLLIVSNCELNAELSVTGLTIWMNPYGYLPGQAYGFMGFYGDMALVYLFVGLIWFVLNAVYFKEVFALQNYIALVLALCMIEMATWYFDYHNLNTTGLRNGGAIFFGIFMSSFRRAVSRMLIIAVAYGWGVVR